MPMGDIKQLKHDRRGDTIPAPQFRFSIKPTAPRRHAGRLNIGIDHRAGTPCLLAVSMFGRWKLWQVAKSCGRKGVPIVSSRIIALLTLLLAASAIACFPTPPGAEADTADPAQRRQATSSWGACAWRTDKLPVPTVSADYDNAVWTITAIAADTGTQQPDSILLYYFGRGIPGAIEEIPLQDGAGSGSVTVSAGPDANIYFDVRTIRRNALNLVVCSYDGAPSTQTQTTRLYPPTITVDTDAANRTSIPSPPRGEQQPWPIPDLSVETPTTSGTSVAIQLTNPSDRTGSWYGHCRYRKLGNPIALLSDVHVTTDPIGPMQSDTLTITGLTEGARYQFHCYLDTQRGRIQGASTSNSVTAIP